LEYDQQPAGIKFIAPEAVLPAGCNDKILTISPSSCIKRSSMKQKSPYNL